MKHLYALLLLCLSVSFGQVAAQNARDRALELKADHISSHTNTLLSWPKDTTATGYEIYIRDYADNWYLVGTAQGGDSTYLMWGLWASHHGFGREVWVKKQRNADSVSGYIYISPDLIYPYWSLDNILLLVIDSNYAHPLNAEINRLIGDLEQERWVVRTFYVQRSDSVQKVKNWIRDQWQSDSLLIKSVILLGHVPVPYSGNLNPDAHSDHQGAWPADVYYVTFDLNWTDQTVNTTSASRSANHNVPGDGKFDQDYIWPGTAKIPLGRVDLYDMPAFGDDTTLMRQYLNKNHLFRTGRLQPENRALIDDHFGYFSGEAFAANGWRVFTPIFDQEVYEADYFSSMGDSSFLFSYGCGAGSYTSANGIGTSTNFAADSLLNPFTLLFGSYFGDWDNTNNFLRAPLASKGWGLASAWAGRPFWMFHHSALNEPIGVAALKSQNAWPQYDAGYSGSFVHTALMGDPSLKLYNIKPLDSVWMTTGCPNGTGTLYWTGDSLEADSVFIFVFSGPNQVVNTHKISYSQGEWALNLNPGDYTIRLHSQTWMNNPSGYFEVFGHGKTLSLHVPERTTAKISANDKLCYGDSLFYHDSSAQGTPYTRNWYMDQVWLGDSDAGALGSLSPGHHVLKLVITDSLGCITSDSILVYQAPEPHIDSLRVTPAPGPLCEGGSTTVDLVADIHNPSGSYFFYYVVLWGDGGQSYGSTVTDQVTESHNYGYQGNYTGYLILSDSSGFCVEMDSFEVQVNPQPATPVITPQVATLMQNSLTLRSEYNSQYTYFWNTNGCSLQASDSVHKKVYNCQGAPAGLYMVTLRVMSQDSCFSEYDTAVMNNLISSVAGAETVNWTVYPNPVSGILYIDVETQHQAGELILTDLSGKQICMETLAPGQQQHSLDLSLLPPGTYFLGLKVDGQWQFTKVVKY